MKQEKCWLNKEEVVLRWSSSCFVERITTGEEKVHVGATAGTFVYGAEKRPTLSLYSTPFSSPQIREGVLRSREKSTFHHSPASREASVAVSWIEKDKRPHL